MITMRRKFKLFLLMILVLSNFCVGENGNKAKSVKTAHKIFQSNKNQLETKTNIDRNKRSLDDVDDKPFWANRGKKQSEEFYIDNDKLEQAINRISKSDKIIKDPPFWGNRGRRDSASSENYIDDISFPLPDSDRYHGTKCKYCHDPLSRRFSDENSMNIREEMSPFWGNRGRRNSDEAEIDGESTDFSPFWGNRGRRQEDSPFWGNRGRREEEPFWGNRGRRDELPFWGNRGRRTKLKKIGIWEDSEDEPFWGNRGRRRDLADSIREAINEVEDEIGNLSNNPDNPLSLNRETSFWNNQGRDSKLKHLFNGKPRYKYNFVLPSKKASTNDHLNPASRTMSDSRIYAEEPHYIVVERSSRSSGEIDPYIISRGKKMNIDLEKAARDRRGAIEDIVKTVKNDPYFIVRGKKPYEDNDTKADNSTALHNKYAKAKELICATVDIMLLKKGGLKNKRETPDNDRGRRAILNKLAAQLQIDPYFVSRGKKNNDWTNKDEYLAEFIDQIHEMCN